MQITNFNDFRDVTKNALSELLNTYKTLKQDLLNKQMNDQKEFQANMMRFFEDKIS